MRKTKHLCQVLGLFVVALASFRIVNLVRNDSKDIQSTAVPSKPLKPVSSKPSMTVPSKHLIALPSKSSTAVPSKPLTAVPSKPTMAVSSKPSVNNSSKPSVADLLQPSIAVPSNSSTAAASKPSTAVPPKPRKVKSNQTQELEKTWKIGNDASIIGVRSASNNSTLHLVKEPQIFPIILHNASVCETSIPEGHVYLITIVHSARGNTERRQVIRDTWGSITSVNNQQIRIVFLLGSDQDASEAQQKTDESILTENKDHGDIVMGGFHDSYRNLTYKHLMGYRWVLEHCSKASFILKTDDDIFVDIKELVKITKTTTMQLHNALLCNEMSGYAPVRSACKQAVVVEEYPHDFFPGYCSGLAYVISQDALKKIFDVSLNTRFFWIDDVYVTGMLRELAKDAPGLLALNDKYNFNTNVTEARKSYYKTPVKPFVISLIEPETFAESMKFLWTAVNTAS